MNPLDFPEYGQCGISGLSVRIVPDAYIARFSRGARHCDIKLQEIIDRGDDWVNRKLRRFRRYVRRMQRAAGESFSD